VNGAGLEIRVPEATEETEGTKDLKVQGATEVPKVQKDPEVQRVLRDIEARKEREASRDFVVIVAISLLILSIS